MRVPITGAFGQVGYELRRTLAAFGEISPAVARKWTSRAPTRSAPGCATATPQVIVSAGAYTAVDRAESEPEAAMAVNGTAPGVLAEEAKRLGAALIHYSTDFGTTGARPRLTLRRTRQARWAPTPAASLLETRRSPPLRRRIWCCAQAGFTALAARTFCSPCGVWRGSAMNCGWWTTRTVLLRGHG